MANTRHNLTYTMIVFESLEDVQNYIEHCPDHVQPALWNLYLEIVRLMQEKPERVYH